MLVGALLLGLLAAVLVNSLADNLPPDALGVQRPPDWPRCQYCGERHSPLFWLSTIAYLLRAGRCEHCAAPRPVRPALVEIGMALGSTFLWGWAGGDMLIYGAAAIIFAAFALITIIDIEHRLILRAVSLPALIVLALVGSLTPERGPGKTLLGGLGGFAITFGLFLFGQLFSLVVARLRGQPLEEIAFGGGDVNLGALVGLVVGWPGVLIALVLAVLAAGAFSAAYVVVQLLRRRYNPYAAIPYGPFLILGASLVYLYGKDLAVWYQAG